MKVYKYDVPDVQSLGLTLPEGATLLKFNYQDSPYGSGFKLWALVDPLAPQESRNFILVGTGEETHHPTSELKYISTAEHGPTELVAHLFEVVK